MQLTGGILLSLMEIKINIKKNQKQITLFSASVEFLKRSFISMQTSMIQLRRVFIFDFIEEEK